MLLMFCFDAVVVAIGAAFGFHVHAAGLLLLRVLAHLNPLYYTVTAARVLAAGTFTGPAVWQAFAVLTPLCVVVLGWATAVARRAVA